MRMRLEDEGLCSPDWMSRPSYTIGQRGGITSISRASSNASRRSSSPSHDFLDTETYASIGMWHGETLTRPPGSAGLANVVVVDHCLRV